MSINWRYLGCKLSDMQSFIDRGESEKQVYLSMLYEIGRIANAEIERLSPAKEVEVSEVITEATVPPEKIEEKPAGYESEKWRMGV